MLIFTLLFLGMQQDICPQVFYLSNIPSLVDQITYSSEYNFIIASMNNGILFIQAESGTFRQFKQTSGQTVYQMMTSGSNLLVGETNQLLIYSLDEENPITNSLSVQGNVEYIQMIGKEVSVATNQNLVILWDINQNSIDSRLQSLQITSPLISYQIELDEYYDTILIGTNAQGAMYLEYYTQNMQYLLNSFQINPFQLSQISSSIQTKNTQSFIYAVNSQTLYIYQVSLQSNQVTLKTNQVTLSFIPITIELNENILFLFSNDCNSQQYDTSKSTLGQVQQWASDCPNSIKQLTYSVTDSIIILLLQAQNQGDEIIRIYQLDQSLTGNNIRQFYYYNYQISYSYILQSQYIIEASTSSSNLFIYNQWYQLQNIITVSNNNYKVIQIIQSAIILVLYENGLVISLSETSQSCQFTGYQCYQYAVQQQFQNQQVTNYQNQIVNSFTYNNIIYAVYVLNTYIYFYSYQNQQFSNNPTNSQTLQSNILQILLSDTQIKLLSSDNILYCYSLNIATTTTQAQQISYQMTGITQITENSDYQIITNGIELQIYNQPNTQPINKFQQIGTQFKQIQIYNDQLIVLEQSSYKLQIYSIDNLLSEILQPYLTFQTQFYSEMFTLNSDNLIIQFKLYVMRIQLTSYISTLTVSECAFTQVYDTNQIQFINTQITLSNFYILYLTIQQLFSVFAKIQINKQNIYWNQIIIDQSINSQVQLYITGKSETDASIVITDTLNNFEFLNFETITIILPACKLYLNSIIAVNIDNVSIKYQNKPCFYFNLNKVNQFNIQDYQIDNFQFTDSIFTVNDMTFLQIQNIKITNSQLLNIVTTQNELHLIMKQLTISYCKFTQNYAIFQYHSLDVQDSTFSNNQFQSLIFDSFQSATSNPHSVKLTNIQVQNNKFTSVQSAAIINQILTDEKQTAQIQLNQILISGNTYPKNQRVYAMNFVDSLSISAYDLTFDNSSIALQLIRNINLTLVTFSSSSQLSVFILESPIIYLDRISFQSGSVEQDGLIVIKNEQDYDCSNQQNCQLQLSRIIMQNINLISNSLADQCYGISIYLNNAFQVQLSSLNFFNLLLKSGEQNLISSATSIYFQGYSSYLTISSSVFSTIRYSLSTSLFVLNALTISLNLNNINTLNTVDNIYSGTQSEKGGVAQIVAASFYAVSNNISAVTSYSGSVFIVQLFHSSQQMPNIILTNNLINNIYSFGNGAIYIENSLSNIQITFQNNYINDVYSLGEGGLLYCQDQQSLKNKTQSFAEVMAQNGALLTKTITLINNTFANLYSNGGSLLYASFYNIVLKNNNQFIYNNQTQIPSIFNTFTLTQNSLFQLYHCNVTISDFLVQNIQYFQDQISEGQIFNGQLTSFAMENITFQNIKTKRSQLIYLQSCSFNVQQIYFTNIIFDYSQDGQSLIEIYQSQSIIIQIYMINLVCQNVKCISSGFYAKETYFEIRNGICQQNIGNFGSCFYITNPNITTIIDSFIFTQNSANYSGGAIFLDLQNTSSVAISNCQFAGNTALDSGGAIYLDSLYPNFQVEETQDYPVLSVVFTKFINNTAHKYGGAMKILVFYPKVQSLNFTNNTAYIEGNDISSYPTSLFLVGPIESQQPNNYVYDKDLQPVKGYYFVPYSNNGQYFLKNFKSGDTLDTSLQFIFKSDSNQTMYNDKTYLKIYPSSVQNYSISISNSEKGQNEVRFQNGSFTLEGLNAVGIPNTEFAFYFTSDEIKTTNKFNYYFTNNYNYTFFIVFRECLYGEILQQFDNQTVCYQCPFGFFSFDLPTLQDPGQCQVCPLITNYHIYCNGGAQTYLQPQYWRENITTLQIYKCDSEFSNCIGGISDYECGIGYMGRMCQACDYDNNYARDTRQVCVFCSEVEWPIAIILVSSIGILIYFTMSIFFLAQDVVILCVLPCLNQLLPPLKKIGSNLGQVKDLNSLMKIFLSYYQKISLVTKIVVDIPSQLQDTQDPSMFDFSLECPMINVNNYIPMVYVNYIIEVLKPISSMIFFMFIWTIIFRKQKIKRGIYYTATWLIIWLFYLPSFYEKTLQLLNCEQIGDGRYLKPDLNQTCYGTVHFFYTLFISIPCLLFFVVYIPVMLLYHIRKDILKKDKRPLRKYKYYYINGEFREKFYYWEFIRLLEKLLIQTCIEIFFYDNIYMAESCLIIVLIYGVASFVTQPYGYKRQNFVNVISSFTAFGTIYIALIIATLKDQFTDSNAPIIIFFEVLLALINAVYALWMAWKLFIVLMPVLFVNIEQIQRKVSNIRFLRQLFLGERLRAKLLFKQLGQRVIVINLIRKHQLQRYFKKELREKQLLELEEKIRNRKQTAAQEALNYILRNSNEDENSSQLNNLNNHQNNNNNNNNEIQFDYVELGEQNQQNQ